LREKQEQKEPNGKKHRICLVGVKNSVEGEIRNMLLHLTQQERGKIPC